jgi:hypothetical protein
MGGRAGTRWIIWTAAVLAAVSFAAGCNIIKGITYFTRPEEKQKAQFEFPSNSRVLVMLDPARPDYESPIFARALYDRLADVFREKKSTVKLISPREILDLRRTHADFDSWSVQRIGRELNADHVMWLKIDRYQTRQSRDYPVLEPLVELRLKVIAVDHPPTDARVWPPEKDGHKVETSRPMREAADASTEDLEARKLAQDAAWLVSFPFFEQSLEESPPRVD